MQRVPYKPVRAYKGLPGPYSALLSLLEMRAPPYARSASETWRPALVLVAGVLEPFFEDELPPFLTPVLVGHDPEDMLKPTPSCPFVHLLLLWRCQGASRLDALGTPGPLVWSWRKDPAPGCDLCEQPRVGKRDTERSLRTRRACGGQTTSEVMMAFLGFVVLLLVTINVLSLAKTRLDLELGQELVRGTYYHEGSTSDLDALVETDGFSLDLSERGSCDASAVEPGILALDEAIQSRRFQLSGVSSQIPLWPGSEGRVSMGETVCGTHGFLHEDQVELDLLQSWPGLLDGAQEELRPLF